MKLLINFTYIYIKVGKHWANFKEIFRKMNVKIHFKRSMINKYT